MRPDYQPEMESCPINIGHVLFYDTVVLVGEEQQDSSQTTPIFDSSCDETHVCRPAERLGLSEPRAKIMQNIRFTQFCRLCSIERNRRNAIKTADCSLLHSSARNLLGKV
jgi:hypothetical protein